LGGVVREDCDNHTLMFGRRVSLSHDGVGVSGGGMEEIGESIHVEIVDEQTVSNAKTVWTEDARGCGPPTARECLQSDYQ